MINLLQPLLACIEEERTRYVEILLTYKPKEKIVIERQKMRPQTYLHFWQLVFISKIKGY
jgi:hypothetical protein